jgi:hypothetical protein
VLGVLQELARGASSKSAKNSASGSFDNVVAIPSLAAVYSSLAKQASQGKAYYISITGTFGVT